MVIQLCALSLVGCAHIISSSVFRHSTFRLVLLSPGAIGSSEDAARWRCLAMFDRFSPPFSTPFLPVRHVRWGMRASRQEGLDLGETLWDCDAFSVGFRGTLYCIRIDCPCLSMLTFFNNHSVKMFFWFSRWAPLFFIRFVDRLFVPSCATNCSWRLHFFVRGPFCCDVLFLPQCGPTGCSNFYLSSFVMDRH